MFFLFLFLADLPAYKQSITSNGLGSEEQCVTYNDLGTGKACATADTCDTLVTCTLQKKLYTCMLAIVTHSTPQSSAPT